MVLGVVVASVQLIGVDLATVKHHALHQAFENRQLHFDVINRAVCIDCLDVQNREFVVQKILHIVRIDDFNVDNRYA